MKRFWMVAVTGVLAIALAGCNGGGTSAKGEKDTATPTSDSPLEAIILEAQADFADTSQKILDGQQKMFSEVGDTYDSYVENVDKVQAWYDLAVSETEALGERAVAYGREYYQAVVDNVDVTDDRAWERATEDFYDAISDDAFDDYYDAVYDDAFDDVYDQYYDGIISDAYDVTPYDEWSDVSSDAYDAYSGAHSDVYDAYSDAHSDVYDDYSDVRSAFYNNDFDVEEIFAPVDLKSDDGKATNQGGATSEDQTSSGSTDGTSAVSADFKAAMDTYEAFFDEYVAFMQAYNADPSSSDLLAQYPDMMTQYADTMSAMNGIDPDSLTPEDYAYYAEVTARITAKVASVA